jgi:monoamine oxidase
MTSSPFSSDLPGGAVDVAVVGAGIAGLFAANRLIDAGATCVVLESRDRIGGRLLSHDSVAGRFDLGATWFWPGEQRVAALVDELHVSIHTVPPDTGANTALSTYAHPLYQEPAGDGRLHWASTETAPTSPGHIEGALASAERTVEAITTAGSALRLTARPGPRWPEPA